MSLLANGLPPSLLANSFPDIHRHGPSLERQGRAVVGLHLSAASQGHSKGWGGAQKDICPQAYVSAGSTRIQVFPFNCNREVTAYRERGGTPYIGLSTLYSGQATAPSFPGLPQPPAA